MFVFDSGPGDFCIFDQVAQFYTLRILLWISFGVLEVAIALAVPLFMIGIYRGFKKKMEADDSRLRYFVWAFIGVITPLVILMYLCSILAIMNGLRGNPPTQFLDVTIAYIFLAIFLVIIPVFDIAGTVFAMDMLSRFKREDDKFRWIDCYNINCLCRKDYYRLSKNEEEPVKNENKFCDFMKKLGCKLGCKFLLKNGGHLYSIFIFTLFTQLVLFNSIFMSLAIVAAPIEAGSLLIMYLASLFTFITYIALILKMAYSIQIQQKTIYGAGAIAFLLIFVGVGLFSGFMYYYTILTQEYQNTTGVIAFIGPIVPSLLASAVGGILIKIFPCIKVKDPDPAPTNQTNTGTDTDTDPAPTNQTNTGTDTDPDLDHTDSPFSSNSEPVKEPQSKQADKRKEDRDPNPAQTATEAKEVLTQQKKSQASPSFRTQQDVTVEIHKIT